MANINGSGVIGGTNQSTVNNFGDTGFWYQWIEFTNSPGNLTQAGFNTANGTLSAGTAVYNAGGTNDLNALASDASADVLGNSRELFGLRVTTTLNITNAGTYNFNLTSDDGAIIYIDGVQVVNDDSLHAPRTVSNSTFLSAGAHEITIIYFERTGQNVLGVSLSGPDYPTTTLLQNAAVQANAGNDSINAGDGNDVIDAGAGNDTINGQGGNDSILGGTGNDSLLGEAGLDTIFGGDGNDTIDGGAHNDRLDGGAGNDSIIGGTGNDSISGGAGLDTIRGGDGNDTIDGGADNDSIFGDAGADLISGGEGNDRIFGGTGNDTIDGGNGADYIIGDEGRDSILGGAGNDTLVGGGEQDTIRGGDGDDVIAGGRDVANQTGLGPYSTSGDTDTTGGDLIFGDAGNDTIAGNYGSDELHGGTGNDLIFGGVSVGDDTIFGDEGDDTIDGGPGNDSVDGGIGNDSIIGGTGNDSITGGAGLDTISGGDGNDTIDGGADNDTIDGGTGNDVIQGGTGGDSIAGGTGIDSISGGDGNDTIDGGTGNDTIDAGEGDDIIRASSGADSIQGGAGTDTYTVPTNSTLGANTETIIVTVDDNGNGTVAKSVNGTVDTIGSVESFIAGEASAENDRLTYTTVVTDEGTIIGLNGATGTFTDNNAGVITFGGAGEPTFATVLAQNLTGNFIVNGSSLTGTVGNISFTDFETVSFSVVCFASGTDIKTPTGACVVETLKVGDIVETVDHGPQAIRWIGHKYVSARQLAETSALQPIRIKANALGQGVPATDLEVSPQHRIVVRSKIAIRMFDSDEVFVPAKHLLGLTGVDTFLPAEGVTYYHILLDQHEVVWANGAMAETLHLGPEAMKTLSRDARAEIELIFPSLLVGKTNGLARPNPKGKLARQLAFRHSKNSQPVQGTYVA